MRIKVDEDLPTAVAQLLQNRGYAASTVVEEGMGGFKDPDLWAVIQEEGKFGAPETSSCRNATCRNAT